MQSTFSVLAALAAVGAAVPLDTRQVNAKISFTLGQVSSGTTNVTAPAVAMAAAINKYGGTPPTAVAAAAAAASQSGTVVATSYGGDYQYLCPVNVGGTTMNLDFDTGSSDLWVFSSLQPSSQQTGHDIYTVSDSKKMSGETWSINYADGSGASGLVYSDKVVVGQVTATKQAVEAATSISSAFSSNTNSDGFLGLAFSTLNTVRPDQQTTFFDSVKDTLARKLFTVDLKKGAAGSYDFGYVDHSKHVGQVLYVPVDSSNGFWQFKTGGYAIGTGPIVKSPYTAIADTGTTLMLVPDSVVSAYYANVSGSKYDSTYGGYTFLCAAVLPDFTARIGGKSFVVPGSYMNYAQISNTRCYGGIQSDSGIGFSIFGDIFLKSQFVVFNMEKTNPRLGFAAQA